MAYWSPILEELAVPRPPWYSAAISVRMSPYRLGSTKTCIPALNSGSINLADRESISSSRTWMPGYSFSIAWATFRKFPSTSLTILAFVATVMLVFPLLLAYSNAFRNSRSAPGLERILKSMARSSPTQIPLLPQMYSPSIFSLKKVQSMPFSGIRMGRTAA